MPPKNAKPLMPPPGLEEIKKLRIPLQKAAKTAPAKVNALDKIALWITGHVGTMGFFMVIFFWTVLWLGWNLLAPKDLQFDPPSAFVFWLFISNLIQLMLMPLIMMGQNIQGREADERAEHDLQVNIKAEREIEIILRHLEYQNEMLIAMMENRTVGPRKKPPTSKK